jgi:flagellar hook assembly protein FlgD
MQNYPNPMITETEIGFTLAEPAMVTINVLDVTGKVVATVTSQNYGAGTWNESLKTGNGAELANGTYVYEMTALTTSGQTIKLARKMTVNK